MYNNYNNYSSLETRSNVMQKVYLWMMSGLLVTGAIAHSLYMSEALFGQIMSARYFIPLMFLFQIGLVSVLSFAINRISSFMATVLYFVYAASLGVTLSPIFYIYEAGSIGLVFGITAATFASMAIYGYYTKADLTSIGNILLMGLYGIIIASIINFFIGSSAATTIISFIGVVIFTGLTAYDVQKIKTLMFYAEENEELRKKLAIICALNLYLDFVNLFLMLLRLLGSRKNN